VPIFCIPQKTQQNLSKSKPKLIKVKRISVEFLKELLYNAKMYFGVKFGFCAS
jgi:hypothetical protein